MLDYIKRHIEPINRKLEEIIEAKKSIYSDDLKNLLGLIDDFNAATYGGKRIRGILVGLGYEISGKEVNDEVYKASAAYELFQTGILIHDDVIDQSELRRGKKTIHNKLGNNHLAMSNAICLGDYGIFLAEETMSDINLNPINVLEALKVYHKTITNTVIGEILDVNLPFSKECNESDVLSIAYYKTAWYTIIGPMLMGALLGGASEKVINAIKGFGTNIGIAFQMQDDILGIFGDEDVVGKSVVSDIKEKKLTILYLKCLEKLSESDMKIFNSYYGKSDVTLDECEIVRALMRKVNATGELKKLIDEQKDKALLYINDITEDENLRKILNDLAIYLVDREK